MFSAQFSISRMQRETICRQFSTGVAQKGLRSVVRFRSLRNRSILRVRCCYSSHFLRASSTASPRCFRRARIRNAPRTRRAVVTFLPPRELNIVRLMKISIRARGGIRLLETRGIPFRSFWLSARCIVISSNAIRRKQLNPTRREGSSSPVVASRSSALLSIMSIDSRVINHLDRSFYRGCGFEEMDVCARLTRKRIGEKFRVQEESLIID